MSPIHLAVGAILLAFGRALFWVFVAVAGFLAGAALADVLLAGEPWWERVLVAVIAGALGALVAIVAERLAFALAGLYAGAYLAILVAGHLGFADHLHVAAAMGGVAGGILAALAMDWSIIVLSSLVGAAAMVSGFGLTDAPAVLLFIALSIGGTLFQRNQWLSARAAS